MSFTMEFDTGNAAFADDNGGDEAAQILRYVAKQVADGFTSGLITDSNGNRIGTWYVEYTAQPEDEGDEP